MTLRQNNIITRGFMVVLMGIFFIGLTPFAHAETTPTANKYTTPTTEIPNADGVFTSYCQLHNETYAAASTKRCAVASTTGRALAQAEDVGPFMCGVCADCIENGTCQLSDTIIVAGNVTNFLLGLVGSIALLLFVLGGLAFLISRGEQKYREIGTRLIRTAVIGIILSLGAVLMLRTVISTLTSGSSGGGSVNGVICDDNNNGTTCGDNMRCSAGSCLLGCDIIQAEKIQTDPLVSYACVDESAYPGADCVSNQCGSQNTLRCCNTDPID